MDDTGTNPAPVNPGTWWSPQDDDPGPETRAEEVTRPAASRLRNFRQGW